MTTVLIEIDVTDVTDAVRIEDAVFLAQVNGVPGPCQFAVRDLDHTRGFVTGQTINLTVGGVLSWSGFVTKIARAYSFAVDDTTDPTTVERWFVITGVDVNTLLLKRVVWNIGNPTKVVTPSVGLRDSAHHDEWAAGVHSNDVVAYVIENYTTLMSDDGVTLDVDDLGSPNPDAAAAYGAGLTVAAFMNLVNALLSGIYYLTPARVLVHRSVETATTDFFLTDHPTGGGGNAVGPRDYSASSDANAMINDALVWGTARGVGFITFSRSQDATAEAAHGRWQYGEFTFQLWKQASVDARATALVVGNETSRKGARYDRLSVEATVFSPIFQLGDVVECRFETFDDTPQEPFDPTAGYAKALLPVRRMEITFPTKTDVKFRLLLSQELDQPWNTFEYFFPKLPGFRPGKGVTLPGLPSLPPVGTGTGPCADCIGTRRFDSFDRTLTGDWANGWLPYFGDGIMDKFSVDGSAGSLDTSRPGDAGVQTTFRDILAWAGVPLKTPMTITWRWKRTGVQAGDDFWSDSVLFSGDTLGSFPAGLSTSGDGNFWLSGFSGATYTPSRYSQFFTYVPDQWMISKFYMDGSGIKGKIWADGDTEPDWQVTATVGSDDLPDHIYVAGTGTVGSLFIDYIDVSYDRCAAYKLDTFDRSIGSGWGTASSGLVVWDDTFVTAFAQTAVLGDKAKFFVNVSSSGGYMQSQQGGPWSQSEWTLSLFVQMFNDAIPFTVAVAPNGGGSIGVQIGGSTILVGTVDDDTNAEYTHSIGTTPLHVKLHYKAATILEAKVWADGDAEPGSYQAYGVPTYDTDSLARLIITSPGISTNFGGIFIYEIDLDYAGRPCFQDCTDTTFTALDTFNRSVTDAWGTPSSGPFDNGSDGSWYMDIGDAPIGVDGAMGWADLTDSNALFATSGATANPPWVSGKIMLATFQIGTDPVGDDQAVTVGFARQQSDANTVEVVVAQAASQIRLNKDSVPGVVSVSIPDPPANTPIYLKWEYIEGGASRAKVWSGSDPEPGDWQVTRSDVGDGLELHHFYIHAVASYNVRVLIDEVAFSGCPDVPPPPGAPGTPLSGRVCETATTTDNTTYQLTRAFIGRSSEVHVNDVVVRRGVTYAYTEDPEAGQIIFNDPNNPTDVVYVCFDANGAL